MRSAPWPLCPVMAGAFWLWVMLAGFGGAQAGDLAAANQATIDAFAAGNLQQAEVLAETAVRLGAGAHATDPVGAVNALNNLGYLLLQRAGAERRAAAVLADAIDVAEQTGQRGTLPWFLAVQNAASAALRNNEPERAAAFVETLITAGRGSAFHADIAGAAADLAFQLGDYPQVADLLAEMVAVGGTLWRAPRLTRCMQRSCRRNRQGGSPMPLP